MPNPKESHRTQIRIKNPTPWDTTRQRSGQPSGRKGEGINPWRANLVDQIWSNFWPPVFFAQIVEFGQTINRTAPYYYGSPWAWDPHLYYGSPWAWDPHLCGSPLGLGSSLILIILWGCPINCHLVTKSVIRAYPEPQCIRTRQPREKTEPKRKKKSKFKVQLCFSTFAILGLGLGPGAGLGQLLACVPGLLQLLLTK